jgi:hypothetical protein
VLASSGTEYIFYESFQMEPDAKRGPVTSRRRPDAWLDLSGLIKPADGFVSPFTTTLVEIYLDREPSEKLVTVSK